MKQSFFLLAILFLAMNVYSQNSNKQHEVGIGFNNLDNFEFFFKTGTEKSLWRFNYLYTSGSQYESETPDDSTSSTSSSFGGGLKIGNEFHIAQSGKLDFYIGGDLGLTYSKSTNEYEYINNGETFTTENLSRVFKPGLDGIIGLSYAINTNIRLGVELSPGIYYQFVKNSSKSSTMDEPNENKRKTFGYNLSSNSAKLTLACRF